MGVGAFALLLRHPCTLRGDLRTLLRVTSIGIAEMDSCTHVRPCLRIPALLACDSASAEVDVKEACADVAAEVSRALETEAAVDDTRHEDPGVEGDESRGRAVETVGARSAIVR